MPSSFASFDYESRLWRQSLTHVAGIDEVGRGALAGPVVVASVVFSPYLKAEFLHQVNDSKLVSPKERIKLDPLIKQHATYWSIATSSVSVIDKQGIVGATFRAMRTAINKLPSCQHVLVDAFRIPHLRHLSNHQTPIIRGDQKSLSIAAASIIAKVYRDNLMKKLHTNFPAYGFAQHKGYGTRLHQEAIRVHGPCIHHRTNFISKISLSD